MPSPPPTPTGSPLAGLANAPARRTHLTIVWNGVDLGLSDEIDPTGFKLEYEPIMTLSTGAKVSLGDRLVGAGGRIKLMLRQPNLALYAATCPWANGSTLVLTPPLNVDMYQYAQRLVLHPIDLGTATTEDVVLFKAVPVTPPGLMAKTGKDDVYPLEFAVYPDRAALAANPLALSFGQIGQ